MVLTLSIGGIPLRFEIRSKDMALRIAARYSGFLLKRAAPAITFNCTFTGRQLANNEDVSVSREDVGTWCIYRSDFICTFQESIGTIEVHRSIFAFDACLRALYATILNRRNGFLLHSAGVLRKNNAFCFAGVSGSGKTTIAHLAPGYGQVLNDEIIACRIVQPQTIMVYGTPFWGAMRDGPAYNKGYPLKALCFLIKDTATTMVPLAGEDALIKLLRCCCIFSDSVEDSTALMRTGAALVNTLPVYDLHFKKSPALWNGIQ